jgi:hypothetical protein
MGLLQTWTPEIIPPQKQLVDMQIIYAIFDEWMITAGSGKIFAIIICIRFMELRGRRGL